MSVQGIARCGEARRGAPDVEEGAPLVFQLRAYHPGTQGQRARQRWLAWVAGCAMFVLLAVQLDRLLASLAASADLLARWEFLGRGLLAAWVRLRPAQLSLYGALVVAVLFLLAALHFHQKRARLVLDGRGLHYDCGIPGARRWLNWRLEFDSLRSGSIEWQLTGGPAPANPLAQLRLKWHGGPLGGLSPAHWFLSGGPVDVAYFSPHSVAGWVNWRSSKNHLIVVQVFETLPLIRALRERGIPVPSPDGRVRGVGGVDLLAYPRMRGVVWAFFGCVAAALAIYLATSKQHYFTPPAERVWIAAGFCVGLAALCWMWGEVVRVPLGIVTRTGFRCAQAVVASTFGVAVALCAPSVPLLWSLATNEPREVDFIVATLPDPDGRVVLRPLEVAAVPSIYPPRYQDRFWKSLPSGQTMTLKIRSGVAGSWWQFDSSVIEKQWEPEHAQ